MSEPTTESTCQCDNGAGTEGSLLARDHHPGGSAAYNLQETRPGSTWETGTATRTQRAQRRLQPRPATPWTHEDSSRGRSRRRTSLPKQRGSRRPHHDRAASPTSGETYSRPRIGRPGANATVESRTTHSGAGHRASGRPVPGRPIRRPTRHRRAKERIQAPTGDDGQLDGRRLGPSRRRRDRKETRTTALRPEDLDWRLTRPTLTGKRTRTPHPTTRTQKRPRRTAPGTTAK